MEVKIETTLSATEYISIPYPDGFNYNNCYIAGGMTENKNASNYKYPLDNTGVVSDITIHKNNGLMVKGTENSAGCMCTIILRKYSY